MQSKAYEIEFGLRIYPGPREDLQISLPLMVINHSHLLPKEHLPGPKAPNIEALH